MVEQTIDLSICKWPYALVNGQRKHISEAVRGERGICPLCGAELSVREGTFRSRHWWHVGGLLCDPNWYEPKGPWHRYWQGQFPIDWQEVVIERNSVRHIADIQTSSGVILEIQWSAISRETILQRECFYKRMIWIAGMNRLNSDRKMLDIIRRRRRISDKGRRYYLISESDFPKSQKWLSCSRPVFFDFDGTFSNPEGTGPLYYLMPKRPDEPLDQRFVLEVDRIEFLSALREDRARTFFAELKQVRDIHISQEKMMSSRFLQETLAEGREHRSEIVEMEWQNAKPYMEFADHPEYAIEFANERFHVPPRFALTLGWVEAILILKDRIAHSVLPVDMKGRAPYGRLAIHFAAIYSRVEYEKDMVKARELGVDGYVGPYEELQQYKGRMVGCVDYLVKGENDGMMFTFRRPYQIFHPGQKSYVWNHSAIAIWNLPEETQSYLGYVDLFSNRF